MKDLLGHSNISQTLRYAHIGDDRPGEAARALEALAELAAGEVGANLGANIEPQKCEGPEVVSPTLQDLPLDSKGLEK